MQDVFAGRRACLLESLPAHCLMLVPAATIQFRNHDVEFPFRQDSNFFYLTGIEEANAVAVIRKTSAGNEFLLFCQEKDPAKERWTGARIGPEDAVKIYGAHQAWPITEIDMHMPGLIDGCRQLFYPKHNLPFGQQVTTWVEKAQTQPELMDMMNLLAKLRVIKERGEVEHMRYAAKTSALAHQRLMQLVKPDSYEYQLAAAFAHDVTMAGCQHLAYPSIVAGGERACVLHYTANNQQLKAGELCLVDAGAEYKNYASDITRTFPVNGRFTKEQRALYECVLEAQDAGIAEVRPGAQWQQIQNRIVDVMVEGLLTLGLLSGNKQDLIAEKAYRRFYMHNSGHWLGLDVHDAGDYQEGGRVLEANMALTVEPGLYIDADDDSVDKKWRGIGIRIEDDVLVTATGSEILSKDVVKTVNDIEMLMA